MLAVVGTRQATIQIFLFDLSNGLIPLLENPSMSPGTYCSELRANVSVFEGNIDGQLDLFICESAALLTTDTSSKLLCGLRGGTVIVMDIKWGRCKLTIHWLTAYR